jgi:CHAD domain-containing protein
MGHATTPISEGLARVTADHAAKWRHALPHARRGDARGVHHVRTASRRLREALKLAAEAVPDAGAERLRRDVRKASRACAALRDADVRIETFRREVRHGDFHPGAIACVQRALTTDRDAALEALPTLLGAIDLDRWQGREKTLTAALEDTRGSAVVDRAMARQVRRRAGDLRRALDEAGTLYSPERLHRARIGVKKLRYLQELTHALGSHAPDPTPLLKRMQGELGRMQDLHVLEQRIRAIEPEVSDAGVTLGLTAIADAVERDGRAAHARFLRHVEPLRDAARETALTLSAEVSARRSMIRMKPRATPRPRRARTA